jgi:hypothetical protein
MPFVDVNGSTGATSPEQIGVTTANVGVILGFTVTVKVVVVAHWPASGVNVYVAVAVLLTTAGAHVPVMPFVDVNGSNGAVEPSHIAATGLKVGVMFGVIVISNVVVAVAHWPAVGVNV